MTSVTLSDWKPLNLLLNFCPNTFPKAVKKSERCYGINQELTGDKSVSDNYFSKETDEKMKMILWATDANAIRNLCILNQQKGSFDPFWRFTELKTEELTAVNDRHRCDITRNGNVAVKLGEGDWRKYSIP